MVSTVNNNNNNNNNSDDRSQIVKPTEAQLRWAQFHYKKQARQVRIRVDRMWQTPHNVSDVDGAQSDDGVTTDEGSVGSSGEGVQTTVNSSSNNDSSSDTRASESNDSAAVRRQRRAVRNKNKPTISRGRRAMLRVSKRKYLERRELILKEGFQCCGDKENDVTDDGIAAIESFATDDDVVNDILMPDGPSAGAKSSPASSAASRQSRRRQKRRSKLPKHKLSSGEDEARSKRFEEAFSMLMSLKPKQQPVIIKSSRRWTRPKTAKDSSAVNYSDWKLGLARRKRAAALKSSKQKSSTNLPFDRRASWLVHLPAKENRRHASVPQGLASDGTPLQPVNSNGDRDVLMSPGELKFHELIARLQQMDSSRPPDAPLPGHIPEGFDVSARYLDNLPQAAPIGSPQIVRRSRRSVDGLYHSQEDGAVGGPDSQQTRMSYGSVAPGGGMSPEAVLAILLGEDPNDFDPSILEDTEAMQGLDDVFYQKTGKRLDDLMDALQEGRVGESGSARTSLESGTNIPMASPSSIEAESDYFDEQLVGQANGDSIRASPRHSMMGRASIASRSVTGRPSEAFSLGASSCGSDFFRQQRELNARDDSVRNLGIGRDDTDGSSHPVHRLRGDVNEYGETNDMEDTPSVLNDEVLRAIPESSSSDQDNDATPIQEPHGATDVASSRVQTDAPEQRRAGFNNTDKHTGDAMNVPSDHDESPSKQSATQRVRESVGSFFSMISSKASNREAGGMDQNNADGPADDDDDATFKALAKFHKTQDDRDKDERTSVSSFRLLPDGIRKVVQDFSSTRLLDPTGKSHEPDDGSLVAETDFSAPVFGDDEPSRNGGKPSSPARSSRSSAVDSGVSPEHGRLLQQNVMQHSQRMMEGRDGVIDTDDTTSDASGAKMDPRTAASLMLSPTILNKRLLQAIRSVEHQNWEQTMYLINANPWLAEMMEVTSEQYLLHKVALCGSGRVEWSEETGQILSVEGACPSDVNEELLQKFPNSVHKFDKEGNLPLHMAAASGNYEMVRLLGERFPSGASVRNNDGMLPIHLAIQACANPISKPDGEVIHGSEFIECILNLFPGAVAVSDNEGDLPIHIAAATLEGDVGVDVIYVLLDVADRLARSEQGLRFSDKVKVKHHDDDTASVATLETATPSSFEDDHSNCSLVKNDMGRTPLIKAIEAGSGWEVIEALSAAPGGHIASIIRDVNQNNALHLLLTEEFGDPTAALSILKVAPDAATARNAEGMLPIEVRTQLVLWCEFDRRSDRCLLTVVVLVPGGDGFR